MSQDAKSTEPSLERSKPTLSNAIQRMTRNRYVNLIVGLLLIAFSLDEVWESLQDGIQMNDLNASIGIVLVGMMHVLKVLPDIFEGLEHLEDEGR